MSKPNPWNWNWPSVIIPNEQDRVLLREAAEIAKQRGLVFTAHQLEWALINVRGNVWFAEMKRFHDIEVVTAEVVVEAAMFIVSNTSVGRDMYLKQLEEFKKDPGNDKDGQGTSGTSTGTAK